MTVKERYYLEEILRLQQLVAEKEEIIYKHNQETDDESKAEGKKAGDL